MPTTRFFSPALMIIVPLPAASPASPSADPSRGPTGETTRPAYARTANDLHTERLDS